MSAPERIWAWVYADPWGNELRWFEWQDHTPQPGDAEYIRADLAPAAPKVKALVWKWHRDPRDTAEARTTIGTWTIWEIDGSAYCHGPNDTCGKPCKGGLDGAKATAQADYEARILAALEGGDG